MESESSHEASQSPLKPVEWGQAVGVFDRIISAAVDQKLTHRALGVVPASKQAMKKPGEKWKHPPRGAYRGVVRYALCAVRCNSRHGQVQRSVALPVSKVHVCALSDQQGYHPKLNMLASYHQELWEQQVDTSGKGRSMARIRIHRERKRGMHAHTQKKRDRERERERDRERERERAKERDGIREGERETERKTVCRERTCYAYTHAKQNTNQQNFAPTRAYTTYLLTVSPFDVRESTTRSRPPPAPALEDPPAPRRRTLFVASTVATARLTAFAPTVAPEAVAVLSSMNNL